MTSENCRCFPTKSQSRKVIIRVNRETNSNMVDYLLGRLWKLPSSQIDTALALLKFRPPVSNVFYTLILCLHLFESSHSNTSNPGLSSLRLNSSPNLSR